MLEQFIQPIGNDFLLNTLGILICLIALETVLSADNAVALAALVQHLPEEKHQKIALNWGLVGAFILRIILIIISTWVVQFWQFQLIGALYLLWLTAKYFYLRLFENNEEEEIKPNLIPTEGNFFWQIIPFIAVTDLAFSLDSVTTAIALDNDLWLVLTGGLIGIIALRFLAALFIEWLNKFTYLQDAAYLTIFWVGIRLFLKALLPDYVPPEWLVLSVIVILFSWGFSKRDNLEIL